MRSTPDASSYDPPFTETLRDQMCAGVESRNPHGVADVFLDRVVGQVEVTRDIAGAPLIGERLEDLNLPRTERPLHS